MNNPKIPMEKPFFLREVGLKLEENSGNRKECFSGYNFAITLTLIKATNNFISSQCFKLGSRFFKRKFQSRIAIQENSKRFQPSRNRNEVFYSDTGMVCMQVILNIFVRYYCIY